MKLHLEFTAKAIHPPIKHEESILLVGSCFAENIAERLAGLKFPTLVNPNGIIYDPRSITQSIVSYIDNHKASAADLVQHGGLWHSWHHHGSFSGVDADEVVQRINASREAAHHFLKKAKWVSITLGSAFSYSLKVTSSPVANCHKVPSQAFDKNLMTIEDIKSELDTCIHRLLYFNRELQVVFTVSPVRYIRDGLVENNLSKSRLIEVVQHLVSKFTGIYYFPAYELVNDVLRDYRFFKEDMVHPTQQAIDYVFEAFAEACVDKNTKAVTAEIAKLQAALWHRPLHPTSGAHLQFREKLLQKIEQLEQQYPYLSFARERALLASEKKL